MSYVRSFFKNPHLDFSKINAHFTRKHYCRVCLGRKNRIEHLSGRSILPPLSSEKKVETLNLYLLFCCFVLYIVRYLNFETIYSIFLMDGAIRNS